MPDTAKVASRVVLAASVTTVISSLLAGHIETFAPGYFDENVYRRLAHTLIQDGYYGYAPGEQIAWRPPGYPFFLAGLRWIVDAQWFVRIVQALVAGATVFITAWVERRLFGPIAAAATSVLLFLTGLLAAYASFELSETLATFLLVVAAALTLHAVDRRSVGRGAVAGIPLGLSVLTRPQGLIVVLALGIWMGLAFPKGRRMLAGLVLVGATAATVAPWTIRNAVRLHAFVPISTYGGVTLWMTNNPRATGRFPGSAAMMLDPAEFERISALPEVEEDREWFRLAFRFIRKHPLTTLRNWVRDAAIYVGSRDTAPNDRLDVRGRRRVPWLDNRALWPLALAGAVIAVRRRKMTGLLPLFIVAAFVAFFAVFLPVARYRHGAHPFLAAYSGAAVAWLIEKKNRLTRSDRVIV